MNKGVHPAKHPWLFAVLVASAIVGGAILLAIGLGIFSQPETVVQQYLNSLYAQDFARAYRSISTEDKAHKSREEFVQEHNSFTGFSGEVIRQLASYIDYEHIEVDASGERATATAQLIIPDGRAEAIERILFAERSSEGSLSESERKNLLQELDRLFASGQLPTIETEQTLELVNEPLGWRIFEDWGSAVIVHFSGEVKGGLPWSFEPLQERVLVHPGETLQMAYQAKNFSDEPVTAKARHIDSPEEYLAHFDVLQCFCFIQQTLPPGKEVKMPLIFRLAPDTPPEANEFYVHYEFYPLEQFPAE